MRTNQDDRAAREARFDAVYEQCADRVMAYCLRHAGAQEAEDAVAEVFATAWRKLDQLPEPALPWLYVTARTTILSQRRKRERQGQIATRLAPLSVLAAQSPEVSHEVRSELLAVLEGLSEVDREALLLTAWDGLSTKDAAAVLGISAGALRVRLHRARAALRREHRRTDPELMGAHHA